MAALHFKREFPGGAVCGARNLYLAVTRDAGAVTCARCQKNHVVRTHLDAARRQQAAQPDFRVSHHGSIVLVKPLTPAASAWIEANVDLGGDITWWAGALVVEPRYLADLVAGIQGDDLTVAA